MAMHALHVVVKVPSPWEATTRTGSFALSILAIVWLFAMAMHPVSFTLVAEETGCGGEDQSRAFAHPAVVWLEVRVEVLTSVC